jgi:hypothetical protein
MEINCSPDVAQEIMEDIFHDLDDAEVCIDDVGALSNDWSQHLKLLEQLLDRLENNGFTANPLKCEWAMQV